MSKSSGSSNSRVITGIIGLIIAALVYFFGGNIANNSGSGSSGGSTGSSSSIPAGLPSVSFKKTPGEITFNGCPPEGDGGDPVLNRNKNRVDEGNYQPVAFNTIIALTWPQDAERRDHNNWSQSTQDAIGAVEGLPIAVEGYFAQARSQGAESTNCHATDGANVDWHIWLIDHPGGTADRGGSIVVETTPRVRANHPNWSVSKINNLAQAGTRVRVSGWLMFDPEHPDQIGQTRGTIWEIHPIMRIEVQQNNQWVLLDDY